MLSMSIDLRNELRRVLNAAVPFETNWRILRSLRERGIEADDVQSTLESMYQETNDEHS